MSRRRSHRAFWFAALVPWTWMLFSTAPVSASLERIVRTVAGEVEAVNLSATPQIIVVKVMLPTKEAMIVGATVGPDIPITRGKKRASLSDLKAGDHVQFTYEKHETGIAARAIHVH